MKKILLMFLAGLVLNSCVLYEAKSSRSASDLRCLTSDIVCAAAQYPAIVIDNCVRAQDYLNSTEEEKTSRRFSDISYNPRTFIVTRKDFGTISTYGRDLNSPFSEWKVDAYDQVYSVVCIESGRWAVSGSVSIMFPKWRKTNFTAEYTVVDIDVDGLCTLACRVDATFFEDDTYSVRFKTLDCMTFVWNLYSTSGNLIQCLLEGSGSVHADYCVAGKKTDWCTLRYSQDEIKSCQTSLD